MRLKIRLFIILIALLVFPSIIRGTVFAAEFKVTGTAIEGKNNPVVNSKVTVTDALTQRVITTATSDQNGYYNFFVPKGTYNIITSPPAGSGLQSTTYSHITISSDMSLHNYMGTVNTFANSAQENTSGSSIKKVIGLGLMIMLIGVFIAAIGLALVKKKDK